MPANLTPEYKAAADALRKARDPHERLECLREMLRVIPRHKGTDHLQADLKHRIRELAEELEAPRRGGARSSPSLVVRPEGAAQIALLGPPNSGKSLLHAQLTGSTARSGPYPHTTRFPEPGMLRWEDVSFQLVDLPAIAPEHPVPWLGSALQSADAGLLVIDLGDPDCLSQLASVRAQLAQRQVHLVADWPGEAASVPSSGGGEARDVLALPLPTLLLANQSDRVRAPLTDLEALRELEEPRYPVLLVSALTGQGLGELGAWLWRSLGLVRVYTKAPGKPPEHGRPFTLRRGEQSVAAVAHLVHRDMATALKYARVWGASVDADGQHVGREHVLADGDTVELHV